VPYATCLDFFFLAIVATLSIVAALAALPALECYLAQDDRAGDEECEADPSEDRRNFFLAATVGVVACLFWVGYSYLVRRRVLQEVKSAAGGELDTSLRWACFSFVSFDKMWGNHAGSDGVGWGRLNEYDIFISHSQASGGDQAYQLVLELQRRGYNVWYDQLEGIDATTDGMLHGVEQSKAFLLFLSEGVFDRYVPWESIVVCSKL
jgi:hypothetical protein